MVCLGKDDSVYSIYGTIPSPPGRRGSEGGHRHSERGMKSGGIQSFGQPNGWDRCVEASYVRHSRSDRPSPVVQHSPGLLAD